MELWSVYIIKVSWYLIHLFDLWVFYSGLHLFYVFFYLLNVVCLEVYLLFQLFVLLFWVMKWLLRRATL